MMRALLWVSVVVAGAAAAYLIVGYVVALRLSAPTHQPVNVYIPAGRSDAAMAALSVAGAAGKLP